MHHCLQRFAVSILWKLGVLSIKLYEFESGRSFHAGKYLHPLTSFLRFTTPAARSRSSRLFHAVMVIVDPSVLWFSKKSIAVADLNSLSRCSVPASNTSSSTSPFPSQRRHFILVCFTDKLYSDLRDSGKDYFAQ